MTALDGLCAHYGIATSYSDIWGKARIVSDDTKRALLTALGVPSADDMQITASLRRVERASWDEQLPPVHVVREGDEIELVVTLPAQRYRQPLRWGIVEESGARQDSAIAHSDWIELERREWDGVVYRRATLRIAHKPGLGYHSLSLTAGAAANETIANAALVVVPRRCYAPPALEGMARIWGLSVQLYSVRSQRNCGIGDFTDLRNIVEWAAAKSASYVGINPLHALFGGAVDRDSPYSPSSRSFLSAAYIDIHATAAALGSATLRERLADEAIQAQMRAWRSDPFIDYATVVATKLELMTLAYRDFCGHHLARDTVAARAFAAFKRNRGDALHSFAVFEALREQLAQHGAGNGGWRDWPQEYHAPNSPAVQAFVRDNGERVDFHCFLQWQADVQLRDVGRRSLELGLGVGLYSDLAVGAAGDGADVWARADDYVRDVAIGAPPDDFNPRGQDWGLPPLRPDRLRATCYAPFIAALRANMRHAGALRIDHVMGLMRLFWVPTGGEPADGTYVSYPFDDMLGILALESKRNRCAIVGEDLGTVPNEMRDAMRSLGVLSTRLFYFERDQSGSFKAPSDYEAQALAAVGTHDLPTLAGFWKSADLDLRRQLNLFASEELRERQVIERAQDGARILMALEREKLLPEGMSVNAMSAPEMTSQLACAIYAYLARTPSQLVSLTPEDVFGLVDQMNLPGTTREYPNWRRKLPVLLEEWASDPRMNAFVRVLSAERGMTRSQLRSAAEETRPPRLLVIPRATYRLQLSKEFTFAQATAIVPYLSALGISHCYTSPYLKARPGSLHGYDIVDHSAFNPEIGSEEDFARFVAELRRHDMGHILDMVPNHMGIMASDNAWWLDVLENGPAAKHADFFDIDWDPILEAARGKVLVPVLGDQYGSVLEQGQLRLTFDRASGEFSVVYYEHRFPISPREYPRILSHRIERLVDRIGSDHPSLLELQSLITAFGHLPGHRQTAAEKVAERARDKELYKKRLATLIAESADLAHYLDENIDTFNAASASDQSRALLHELLEAQAYRLSFWRVAADDINYRRFFDINDLAALRMEKEEVFAATHRLILRLLADGLLDGLRIDHPDGLFMPKAYFDALQRAALPAGSNDAAQKSIYLVVEKILAGYERLRSDWPVHGTTGYEFCNLVNGLFVDGSAEAELDAVYEAFVDDEVHYDDLLYQNKRLIMRVSLASELNVLAVQLQRIAVADTHTRDFTLNSLRDALVQIIASFPVYRTYITAAGVSAEDRRYVDWAVGIAKRRSRAADVSVFDFVRDVLLIVDNPSRTPAQRDAVISFAMKFQQFTGPVMAKAMEDTTFYRYNRLVALNEVGGEPKRCGTSIVAFHRANQERLAQWPHAMLSTSTHDSKRSEDVRCRIDVLSELRTEWGAAVQRWRRINRGRRRQLEGEEAMPSYNDEYLLYQTLVGTWPMVTGGDDDYAKYCERVESYMLKAVREAKVHSSWINPNSLYEKAVSGFVRAVMLPRDGNRFIADFSPFAERVAGVGVVNSLSQTVLKAATPGVPDFYQGSELQPLCLVDPDNRGAVNFGLRRDMLETLRQAIERHEGAVFLESLMATAQDGAAKLYVTWRALTLRAEKPAVFRDGRYLPLNVDGERAEHIVTFARVHDDGAVIVVAPRLIARLLDGSRPWPRAEAWGDTAIRLSSELFGTYLNTLTGERWHMHDTDGGAPTVGGLLEQFPVALLVREQTAVPG